jgi:hypothetical protein
VPGAFSPVYEFSAAFRPPPAQFCLSPDVFTKLFDAVENVAHSNDLESKYSAMGLSPSGLVSRLFSVSCLALAIRFAKIHDSFDEDPTGLSKMVPPDLPVVISDYIRRISEFTGTDGKQWLLHDFTSTVKTLVRAADSIARGHPASEVMPKLWLPVGVDDGFTAFFTSKRLCEYLSGHGFHVDFYSIVDHAFKGSIPPCVSAVMSQLSLSQQRVVLRVFRPYSTERQFLQIFDSPEGIHSAEVLGLPLPGLEERDLDFSFDMLKSARRLSSIWNLTKDSCSSALGVAFSRSSPPRSCPVSSSIVYEVSDDDGRFTLSSYYAMLEEDKTAACCYGTAILIDDTPFRFTSYGFVSAPEVLASIASYDLGL